MLLLNTDLNKLSFKDIGYYSAGYPFFELQSRLELKRANHYVVCGRAGFSDYVSFSKMSAIRATLIPNGIDVAKIQRITSSNGVDENESCREDFIIFTCGRLYASKGIHLLVQAMPKVLKLHGNVRLKIFGDGPLKSHLRKLIETLNLDSKVTLEGHVPYNYLIREMNACDLAVFPSMIEVGASLAVMEAMACRKSVIAFKYPFSTEVISHLNTGYHVSPKDVEGLADAICTLIDDQKLRRRIGENAYKNIVSNHDIKKVVKKYLEVYSDAMFCRE